MMNNKVAEFFENIASLLEAKGDNPFKISAYRRAALNIKNLSEDIEKVGREKRLEDIPGIGKDLAAKIIEIIKTGKLDHYEKLKRQTPSAIIDFMNIPGIGPKTARVLYADLKIKSVEALEKKARQHKISGHPGLKDKTEENIIKGIELIKRHSSRMPLKEALGLAGDVIRRLKKMAKIDRICYAGSLRRMSETVRDIDILVTSDDPKKAVEAFVGLPIVRKVMAQGPTKSSVLVTDGTQVDLRVVEPGSFGAALVYFTGSKAHNVNIRQMAKKKGLKINEYGVFVEKTGKRIAGREEEDIYKTLKLPLIPPELREDRGEVEAALRGALPRLIRLNDIKGDLHVHSNWSDGSNSIEEIALACKKRGYEYVGVSDHSKSLKVAGGLTEKEILKR
ncbi:MAG: helix-hairpin-helix domain-containing protein, partial [Candidatus Omnitrophica bacterium]|nr:helix-hairpin-helix domain-containing protein [Candidatus Omnitrophota bacterium]